VCDDRTHGSVGAGAGNRPGYPIEPRSGALDGRGADATKGEAIRAGPFGTAATVWATGPLYAQVGDLGAGAGTVRGLVGRLAA
jgi:hypothetical protein